MVEGDSPVIRRQELELFADRQSQPTTTMGANLFVALSQFTIANDMSQQVRDAFVGRPHLVDNAPGFLGMEVMSPVDQPQDIWLLTRWRDELSFREWHRGHDYHAAHKGIPKGLKLKAGQTQLQLFDVFAS